MKREICKKCLSLMQRLPKTHNSLLLSDFMQNLKKRIFLRTKIIFQSTDYSRSLRARIRASFDSWTKRNLLNRVKITFHPTARRATLLCQDHWLPSETPVHSRQKITQTTRSPHLPPYAKETRNKKRCLRCPQSENRRSSAGKGWRNSAKAYFPKREWLMVLPKITLLCRYSPMTRQIYPKKSTWNTKGIYTTGSSLINYSGSFR